jgi:CxxC motif-containing protein
MKKEIRCIICPNACNMMVYEDETGEIIVENEGCKKGKEYAKEEYIDPKRILTTTVRVEIDNQIKFLPVKTESLVPKKGLASYMKKLAKVLIKKEVGKGDVVYKNIGNTGVNVIASTDTELLI